MARRTTASNRPLQLVLGGGITKKQPAPPRRSEKVLQSHTRGALGNIGYATMEIGAARKKVVCPCGCGHAFYPEGWMGNDPGFPDLVAFRYQDDFPAVFIGAELKGDKTPIRKEQQALADAGRIRICYSERETIEAVMAAEEAMDRYRFDPRRRERIEQFLQMNQGNLG